MLFCNSKFRSYDTSPMFFQIKLPERVVFNFPPEIDNNCSIKTYFEEGKQMVRKVVSMLAAASLALSMGTVAFADETSTEGAEAPAIISCAGYDDESEMAWTMVFDQEYNKIVVHQFWVDPESDTKMGSVVYSGTPTDSEQTDDSTESITFTDDADGNEYVLDITDVDPLHSKLTLGDYSADVTKIDPKVANIAIGLSFYAGTDSAGNSVAVGWPSDGSTVYYCGYMAEDPSAPQESQFSNVTYDQDGNNITFHLTGNDGSNMDLKVEPIDEAGIHANITIGDDKPFVGSVVDLSAFPAYAEAAGITFGAETEAD